MKILVIQQKMIGDVLTSSILFEALRKKYPQAELHYMIYPHTQPVIKNNPFIDQLVLYDPGKQGGFSGFFSFLKKIKKQKYDVVIDVYSKIGSGIFSFGSGAKIRIAYRKWYTKFLYTDTFNYKSKAETNAGLAIENRMQLLQGISFDFPSEIRPKIFLDKAEISEAEEKISKTGIDRDKPLVMLGILGSSESKTYPLPFMAKILDDIAAKTEAQLLFNYIPKQKEQVLELFEMCQPQTQKRIFLDLFGSSLREFIALTSSCDALIGNEGGAVNMAKAVNTPTFSIFSPQIKKEDWSIYEDGEQNVSVHLEDFQPEKFCGLSKKERRKAAANFYQTFTPELIIPTLDEFLQKNVNHFNRN
ncbi:MAG: glycosyltransferase family 9 protein [Salegentibacter sp.]